MRKSGGVGGYRECMRKSGGVGERVKGVHENEG